MATPAPSTRCRKSRTKKEGGKKIAASSSISTQDPQGWSAVGAKAGNNPARISDLQADLCSSALRESLCSLPVPAARQYDALVEARPTSQPSQAVPEIKEKLAGSDRVIRIKAESLADPIEEGEEANRQKGGASMAP